MKIKLYTQQHIDLVLSQVEETMGYEGETPTQVIAEVRYLLNSLEDSDYGVGEIEVRL